jgi:hypothetical protein
MPSFNLSGNDMGWIYELPIEVDHAASLKVP